MTSAKNKPIHWKSKMKRKTLLNQYESLDYETWENFNKKFISQLEVKGGIAIGKILEDFIDENTSSQVVEGIFPSSQFGRYDSLCKVDSSEKSKNESEYN